MPNNDGGSKSRNVPRRLATLEQRVADLEKGLAETVEELVDDVVDERIHRALGAAFKQLCETFPYDDQKPVS